ncbi:MAG TPA: hydantoinase/oxoprolinase N-terminal domain-containing protein, partial [Gammaproteobacteria bacterium]|nr:hydantoinase/oxoprolinase N-terminal domain-containing protein [Gammaproteobacteria bacterium]
MYKLGIDVGGTHIDYALLDKQNCLVASYKQLASGELITTLIRGLQELSLTSGLVLSDLAVIHLGTTLAMNSLLELKSLYKVGLLRLAGHTPDFPPAYFWPEVYRKTILA